MNAVVIDRGHGWALVGGGLRHEIDMKPGKVLGELRVTARGQRFIWSDLGGRRGLGWVWLP